MQIGTVCPDGFLPAYSVDTESEAKQLLAMIPLGIDGKYYAKELFDSNGEALTGKARVDAFVRFGRRMESIHQQLTARNVTSIEEGASKCE